MARLNPTSCCGMYHLHSLSLSDDLTEAGLEAQGWLLAGGLLIATTNAMEVALAEKLRAAGWKPLEVFGNPGHNDRAVTLWGLRHHQPARPHPSPTDPPRPCKACRDRAERLRLRRAAALGKPRRKKGTS
jgi:hypothetical protein